MTEPTPIEQTATLTVAWPSVRPFGIPLSAPDIRDVWNTFVPQDDRPQSVEERALMSILRSVYDGMYGIYDQATYDAFEEANK